jgi:hypothetical protein
MAEDEAEARQLYNERKAREEPKTEEDIELSTLRREEGVS